MTSAWLVIAAAAACICGPMTTFADNAGFTQPRLVRGGWKPVQIPAGATTATTPVSNVTNSGIGNRPSKATSANVKGASSSSNNVYVVVPTSLLSHAANSGNQQALDLTRGTSSHTVGPVGNIGTNGNNQRTLQLYELAQPLDGRTQRQQRQWFVNTDGLHELLHLPETGTIENFQSPSPGRRPSYYPTQITPQVQQQPVYKPQTRPSIGPPSGLLYPQQEPIYGSRDTSGQLDSAQQSYRGSQNLGYIGPVPPPAPAPQQAPPSNLRQPQQNNFNSHQNQNYQQHNYQQQQKQQQFSSSGNQNGNYQQDQQKNFRQPVYQNPSPPSFPQGDFPTRQPQIHAPPPPAPSSQQGNSQQHQHNNYDQGHYQNVEKEGNFPRRPVIQDSSQQQQHQPSTNFGQQLKDNTGDYDGQKTLPKPRAPEPTTPMYFNQGGKFASTKHSIEQNVVTDYSVKTTTTKPGSIFQPPAPAPGPDPSQQPSLPPPIPPPSSSPSSGAISEVAGPSITSRSNENFLSGNSLSHLGQQPGSVTFVNSDCGACRQSCSPVTKVPPWLRSGDVSSLRQVAADLQADALFTVLFLTESDIMPFIGTTGSYTAFLPSNAGVSRLPSTLISRWQRDKTELLSVLQNHFLNVRASLEELKRRSRVHSRLEGGVLNVVDYFNDTVTVNGRLVSSGDQPGPYGGLVHVIEGVLYPLANKDVVQTMTDCKRFDGFLTLLEGTQLTDILQGDGPFTVFAPSNEALTKIPPKDLKIIRSNMTALKEFLLYHIAHGVYYSNDAREGQYVTSLFQNMPIQLGLRRDGCYRRLVEANVSPLYRSDIPASNGVIHVVDWVLRPVDLDWCEGIILP